MPLTDTIKTTVKSEIDGVSTLGKQAVQSGTHLYPLRGIVYFCTHRALWKPLISCLLPLLATSVGVIVPMFLFTWARQ